MYEPDDIARSIRYYLGMMLPAGPEQWTHRVERREVTDEQRPVSVTLLGDAGTLRAREGTIHQGNVVDQFPVTVYAYPAVGQDARAARHEGDALRSLLHRLIRTGLPPSDVLKDADGRLYAAPFRLPLWDWSGAKISGKRDLPAHPHDVIWVTRESLTTQNLPDPDDERRRAIVLEFSASVEMPGRGPEEADVVDGMPGAWGGLIAP